MSIKNLAVAFGAAVAGNFIAEKFVLKGSVNSPTGFVLVEDGLGLDDAARAACIVGVIYLAHKFIG